ncbi:MAG: TolC family protein [Bacteroidota bacterium]|nr:TolC family protein [Bacteroidota bacterium]MDP4197657.1 TolC family protein [Bacteroidota bacterium]
MKPENKIWIFSVFFLMICFCWTENTQAQQGSLSLKDCIKYAVEKNNDIHSAKIEEVIAEKKVNEVIGSGLPQFNVTGNLVNNLKLPVQLLPGEFFGGTPGSFIPATFGTKYNFTFTGQVTQLLFNGSFWVGLSAAKQSKNYYRQNTENISEQTVYEVSSAYYQTLVIQKQIRLLEYNLVSLEKVLNDTKLSFENGRAKEVDVDRLNVNHNNLQYQLKKAKEGLKQSYNALKYKIGMPLETPISLADSLYFSQDSLSFDKINTFNYELDASVNYQNRSEYRLLQTGLELQELNRKNELSKYLPTISAFGSYSFQAQRAQADLFDSKKDWFKYYSIGLQLSVPIFTGGQTYSKVQQASLEVDKIKENIKKTEQGINLQMSNALIKYNNAVDNIQSQSLNVSLARKVYSTTQLEYQEGRVTASVLIDSETKLREAQTNYVNSLLDLYIARLDVEKAKGTLTAYINSL